MKNYKSPVEISVLVSIANVVNRDNILNKGCFPKELKKKIYTNYVPSCITVYYHSNLYSTNRSVSNIFWTVKPVLTSFCFQLVHNVNAFTAKSKYEVYCIMPRSM